MLLTITVNNVTRTAELPDEDAYLIYQAVQSDLDKEDVLCYADSECGLCSDKSVAAKVRENADEIARRYRHALESDDNWTYLLEGSIESFLEDQV